MIRGLHHRDLSFEMFAAIVDLGGARIAIAPALVARIASHQVGDERLLDARARDHPAQQDARTIAGKWNPR